MPIGFVIDGDAASGQLGMTCAARHTGQLEYKKDGVTHALRIDGAPASADSQQFLIDLTAASRATLAQSARFDAFARAVLGAGYTAMKAAELKSKFGDWVKQFGDFMDAQPPTFTLGTGAAPLRGWAERTRTCRCHFDDLCCRSTGERSQVPQCSLKPKTIRPVFQ